MKDLLPAGELVERLVAEAEERLAACRDLLSGEGSRLWSIPVIEKQREAGVISKSGGCLA